MTRGLIVNGFDYRDGTSRGLTVREWRAALGEVIAEGGRSKVMNGETFALDAKGRVVFEIYDRVPPARRAP